MQTTSTLSLLAIASGVLGLHLPAQTFKSVPAHADAVEGQFRLFYPFGLPGFRTQIVVDAAQFGPTGATLDSMRFRMDRRQKNPAAGPSQVPNVTVELSHTSVAVGSLTDTFANNITGRRTVVFQGTVSLPGAGTESAGPLPWDIVVPFTQPYSFVAAQGNLLIDIVGNNPGGGPNGFIGSVQLDAMTAGGSATPFGTGGTGTFSTSADLRVVNGANFKVVPRLVSPGHTIDFEARLPFNPPGVLALGTTAPAAPIELTAIGAPTNFLYIDPLDIQPLTWVQQSTLPFLPPVWKATVPLAIANNAALIGVTLYGQPATLEPAANALGLVLGNAVEVRIGDEFETFPMQQIDADDPASPTATTVVLGPGGPPENGAVAIRFGGVFF